jgi:hypothetical protein
MDDIINNGEFGEEEFRDMNKIDCDPESIQDFSEFEEFYGFTSETNNDEDLKELNF